MKHSYVYSLIFVCCLFFISCKSSQFAAKGSNVISLEDFRPLDKRISSDSKAVKLSEVVDVRMESWPSVPWTSHAGYRWTNPVGWTIIVEDKILFLTDSVNNESFCTVDYFNPIGMRWDLMTKCEMWICTLDKTGNIEKSKIADNKIIRERLNDSICCVRLKMQDDVAGKILVRKYTLMSPYSTLQSTSYDYTPAKIKPWIFQRDIPLIYGKYDIYLNKEDGNYKVVKLGNGDMDIKSENVYVRIVYYPVDRTRNESTMTYTTTHQPSPQKYKAMKVSATVSNVRPLSKGNDEQPLGIEIIHTDLHQVKIE